jgi:DUF917 family protein
VVTSKDREDRDGYMFGTLEIAGTGTNESDNLRVWFKNENHVTWLNGEPFVCSPDLVTLVSTANARGYTSTEISEGDRVTAVGMRGLDVFRASDALERASGPAYFRFQGHHLSVHRVHRLKCAFAL